MRAYGKPPYSVVLVHGGPGAVGEMKPVAKELSTDFGVLEPWQTKDSVAGQVEELRQQIENAQTPVNLVGYSWGAWLALIVASTYPQIVKKLIMISSGPFESGCAKTIMPTRLSRLGPEDQRRVETLLDQIQTENCPPDAFQTLGSMLSKADAFDPSETQATPLKLDLELHIKVWSEAEALRSSGKLLEYAKALDCPVTVIHGDYDPHPFEGVQKPLESVLPDCNWILLEKCGHTPWFETHAREQFFSKLVASLKDPS